MGSADGNGQVTRSVFISAIRGAPWSALLFGVSVQQLSESPAEAETQLMRTFDALDKLGGGVVDYEELVHFLRGRVDAKLPETLAFLEAHSSGIDTTKWEMPTVPSEACLQHYDI